MQLLVFVGLAVGYTVFFQRHLQVYFTETLLIGGTLSLLGLWKLIWNSIDVLKSGGPDDLLKRTLESPNAREYLAFGTLLLLILFLTTSSIYLDYAGDSGGQSFTVQVWQGNRMLLPPQILNAYEHIKGQPFFLNTNSADIEYRITSPTGYRPLKEHNHLWTAHAVKVPMSFEKKKLQLLRVIPGATLLSGLPDHANDPGRRYALRIITPAQEVMVPNYVKTVVYTGMTAQDLPSESQADERTSLRQVIDDYLSRLQFPSEQRSTTIAKLIASPVLAASAELKAGNVVTFKVFAEDALEGGAASGMKETLVMKVLYTIPADGADVHSVILESD